MEKPKQWVKISITTAPILVETISDYLVGIHGAGVEMTAEEEKPTGTITSFIEKNNLSEEEAVAIISQVDTFLVEMASIFNVDQPTLSWEFIEEEDWGKNWKKHFKPFQIIPGFVISPTWETYIKQENELMIEMDPGMAFGTGHHATTSLSLGFIKQVTDKTKAQSVLDVGCGTGILTMAAALFGAERALGIDNCQDAVNASTDNVLHNHLEKIIDISITPLDQITDSYDIVVANIIHDVLAEMSPNLTAKTKAGGHLILSGLLAEEQADSIGRIFTKLGFTLLEQKSEGEWAALLLQKK